MELSSTLTIIAAFAFLVLVGFAIVVLVQLRRTLIKFDALVTNVDGKLGPLLTDLHATIKQVNEELDQVGGAIFVVKDIGEKVGSITRVVNDVVSSPIAKMLNISTATKEVIKKIVGK